MNTLATVEIGKPQKVVSLGNQEDAIMTRHFIVLDIYRTNLRS